MTHRPKFFRVVWLAVGSLIPTGQAGATPPPPRSISVTIQAGAHDRRDSLVTCAIPDDRFAPEVNRALQDHPVGLKIIAADHRVDPQPQPTIAEARRGADGRVQITWFLPRPLPAGGSARYLIDGGPAALDAPVAWRGSLVPRREIAIDHAGGRPVLRYNLGPTTPPASQTNPNLVRNAYIHPAFSPSGAVVTGDFSAYHPHHRGFFLAYVDTRWGDLAPDFWNIQSGTGRIVAAGGEAPVVGPVTCRFTVQHRWEALRKVGNRLEGEVALREGWEIELYDVPGSPFWLFDLTTTQQAEGHPLEVVPHRYGGMAFRSAEPSVRGPIDVLTAEGRHRFDGDQKPTRWVDLTGPIAEGSPNYAGAMIADHPGNLRYPTVVRIHPITLPFYSFVPAHDEPFTIATNRPTRFRYRVLIHDGRPDSALNDRIAADFVDPPVVTLD